MTVDREPLAGDAALGAASSRRFRRRAIGVGALALWLNLGALVLLAWSGPGAARSMDYYLDRPAAVATGPLSHLLEEVAPLVEANDGDDHWLVSRRWSHPPVTISCGMSGSQLTEEELQAGEELGVLGRLEIMSLSESQ